ncbi:helix-turn-helix transcriptional regulator [Agrobacterium pusense]|uniref:helix-turn-helix transcriptional regulator n=1 Tax=Agrobacterium pusense TaxID=648995 RepID=UPI003D0BC2E1
MTDSPINELDFIEVEENGLMDFQFAILDELESRALSQTDFAKMLGVSKSRVSQLLSSEANPTLKLASRALKVLGLEARYEQIAKKRVNRHADVKSSSLVLMAAYHGKMVMAAWGQVQVHANENEHDISVYESAA